MLITLKDQQPTKISIKYIHKDMKLMMIMRLFLIIFRAQKLINKIQHTILGDGMVLFVENQQDIATRGLGCLDFAKNNSEVSLNL